MYESQTNARDGIRFDEPLTSSLEKMSKPVPILLRRNSALE
jgi:hypothetical protein